MIIHMALKGKGTDEVLGRVCGRKTGGQSPSPQVFFTSLVLPSLGFISKRYSALLPLLRSPMASEPVNQHRSSSQQAQALSLFLCFYFFFK